MLTCVRYELLGELRARRVHARQPGVRRPSPECREPARSSATPHTQAPSPRSSAKRCELKCDNTCTAYIAHQFYHTIHTEHSRPHCAVNTYQQSNTHTRHAHTTGSAGTVRVRYVYGCRRAAQLTGCESRSQTYSTYAFGSEQHIRSSEQYTRSI